MEAGGATHTNNGNSTTDWGLVENCFLKRESVPKASPKRHALSYGELIEILEYIKKRMNEGKMRIGELDDVLLEFEASLEYSLREGTINEGEHSSLLVDYVVVKSRLRTLGVVGVQYL